MGHKCSTAVASRRLTPEDANAFSHLLTSASKDYRGQFFPFNDESTDAIEKILLSVEKDIYQGIFDEEHLLGFYMLRGWDQGYQRPSFGILIAESHSGFGLGKLALTMSIVECRLREVKSIMLKVAGENSRAKGLYELFGFRVEGTCENTGHLMMNLDLSNGSPTR